MARIAVIGRDLSVLGGFPCNRCMRRHMVSTHQPQLHISLGPDAVAVFQVRQ